MADMKRKTTNEERLGTCFFLGTAANMMVVVAVALLFNPPIWLFPPVVLFVYSLFWAKTPQINDWMDRTS